MLSSVSFMSNFYSQPGECQALQFIVLRRLVPRIKPLNSCMLVHFLTMSFKWQLVCKFDIMENNFFSLFVFLVYISNYIYFVIWLYPIFVYHQVSCLKYCYIFANYYCAVHFHRCSLGAFYFCGYDFGSILSYPGSLLLTWFDFNPAWINNYIHYKVRM